MKVLLKKASDWEFHKIIEINTLNELLKIYPILIIDSDITKLKTYNKKYCNDFDFVITIYDDYVE